MQIYTKLNMGCIIFLPNSPVPLSPWHPSSHTSLSYKQAVNYLIPRKRGKKEQRFFFSLLELTHGIRLKHGQSTTHKRLRKPSASLSLWFRLALVTSSRTRKSNVCTQMTGDAITPGRFKAGILNCTSSVGHCSEREHRNIKHHQTQLPVIWLQAGKRISALP